MANKHRSLGSAVAFSLGTIGFSDWLSVLSKKRSMTLCAKSVDSIAKRFRALKPEYVYN